MIGEPKPPVAKRSRHTFSHHGRTIHDDYNWLEDPNYPSVEDSEILDYLNQENQFFEAMMEPHQGVVETIFNEIKGRQPIEDSSVPSEENGFIYQWRFHEDEEYRTWYRAPVSRPDVWSILLDERVLSAGSDNFSIGGISVSDDTKKIAYSIDRDGSERYELFVVDIESGRQLSDPIPNTMGEALWDSTDQGLIYVLLNEQWRPFKVLYRGLNSSGPDAIVYEEHDSSLSLIHI